MDASNYCAKLFCIFYLTSVLPHHAGAESESSSPRKVCRGTNFGLTHGDSHSDERYNHYHARYTNCTYIDGNLELVWLVDTNTTYDLSFLQDIREITGYLLIVTVFADVIPLTGLWVIRGRTLFEDNDRYFSVFVANNYREGHENRVGLRELQLPNLHEIVTGDVFFHDNRRLCYVNTINWLDILPEESVVYNPTTATCPPCHEDCRLPDGSRRCWGSGQSMCQHYTKLICSPQCDGRCRGHQPGDCCHKECAAGCTGPFNTQCLACRRFDNDGSCEEFCPPELIYSEKDFKQIPNPNAKFSYGTLCVDKCPKHLIANRGACVHQCPPGRVANPEGKCVDCDGPCPKKCPGTDDESVTAVNVRNFTGCTVIQGGIKILANALTGDRHLDIPPMNVSELWVFETVHEITDYVQIHLSDPTFVNLTFLRNLEIIHGRKLLSSTNALEIHDTSLKSLDLDALKEVRNGGLYVAMNPQLCYASSLDWRRITSATHQRLYVNSNMDESSCDANGEVCSPECTASGCWGKRDDQCLSCVNFNLEGRCLSSCDALPGLYQSGAKNCSRCHKECKSGCSDSEPSSCKECLHVSNGPYCVSECPTTKYADSGGVCQSCHEYCGEAGCTGPLNGVGPGACNSCAIAVFDEDGKTVIECLAPDSECADGYFKLSLHSDYGPLNGKDGCKRCHPLCQTCDQYGLSYCKSCVYYRQVDRCVKNCSADYYLDRDQKTCHQCDKLCLKCHGPSASNCTVCKQYTVYSDLGKSGADGQSFNCTAKCPSYAPYTFIEEKENGQQMTVCIDEDVGLGTAQIGMIVGIVAGSLILICVVIVVIVICCRQRALAKKKKVPTATLR